MGGSQPLTLKREMPTSSCATTVPLPPADRTSTAEVPDGRLARSNAPSYCHTWATSRSGLSSA